MNRLALAPRNHLALAPRGCLFRPIDGASLAAFRIAFGAVLLVAVARYFALGWIEQFFVRPSFFFPYEGVAWLAPLPAAGMYAVFALMGASALGILLGLFYRPSVILFGTAFSYAHLIDKSNYLNHYYLVSLLCLLLAFLPAHRVWSLDALRDPSLRSRPVRAWAVDLLRFQLAAVYFFGGLAKLNHDWLFEAEPLRIWLAANSDLPVVGPLLESTWVAYAFSWAGLAFDLLMPVLLFRRKTRAVAYVCVVGFHAMTAALFPIGIFPWLMIALTPIFFSADWPRRAIGAAPGRIGGAESTVLPSLFHRRFATALLAGYAMLQVVVPLRHLFDGGDLQWTERGFRFSWQVMAMEKYGKADFRVTDPRSGRTWTVRPQTYLTPMQARMMATQPDMLASFAHFLAGEYAARGMPDVEVRADVYVSLNGRPNRRFVDPRVNLAAADAAADGRGWILP